LSAVLVNSIEILIILNSFKRNTIKDSLGFKYPAEDIAKWDKVDFDRYNEGEEKIQTNNPVLIQRIPGQSFGLTFAVKQDKRNIVCRNTLGYGFRVKFVKQITMNYFKSNH
jgi:hypothetical protein